MHLNESIHTQKKINLQRETNFFMRNIDYARIRKYHVKDLLRYEITCTSVFLNQDEYLRKSPKSELAAEVRKCLKETLPSKVPASDKKCMIVKGTSQNIEAENLRRLRITIMGHI